MAAGVVRISDPADGGAELYGTGIPIVMSGSETTLDRPAPRLGEHTRTVLRELCGYSDERIDALVDAANKAGGNPGPSDDRVLRLQPPGGGAAGKD